MKVDNQLTPLSSRQSSTTSLRESQPVDRRKSVETGKGRSRGSAKGRRSGSYSLQLNQQLTSMQSASSYLDSLSTRLHQLKLDLGRTLASTQPSDHGALKKSMDRVEKSLGQRAKQPDNILDADLKLHLNEPVRSRFSIEGLNSVEEIQRSGKETLLFSAGAEISEPQAVVLDDGLSTQQILQRFNIGLGRIGIRAELDQDGGFKFSSREGDKRTSKGQLRIQGEGKLFEKGQYQEAKAHQEALVSFPKDLKGEGHRELRKVLDNVVAALDKVGSVRDQISHRQQEIREFLARQSNMEEVEWARIQASKVFNLMNQSPSSYAAVSQTVVAQATISRFSVVSMLS